MDALEQMVCGLHLLLLLHVHQRKRLKRRYLSIQGCQRYPAVSDVSHMVANSCWGSPRVFHGILNRNKFYSQYPVFDSIEGTWRYSKFDPSVSIWLHEGIAIPLNTVKYYMGTRLKGCDHSNESSWWVHSCGIACVSTEESSFSCNFCTEKHMTKSLCALINPVILPNMCLISVTPRKQVMCIYSN